MKIEAMRNGAVRGCQPGSQASHRKVGRIYCNLTRLPWCFKHMRHLLRQFKFCDQTAIKTHVDSWRWSGQNWSLTHRNYVRRHLAILPRTYSDLRWHFEHHSGQKNKSIRSLDKNEILAFILIPFQSLPIFRKCTRLTRDNSHLQDFFAPNFGEKLRLLQYLL